MTVTVVLADDHGAIRSGLRMLLEAPGDIQVIGEAADGARAIEQARALRPDVVLMDVRMPGTDGITATREIIAHGHSRVLVLTSFDVDSYVVDSLRAGASGYLLKTASAQELTGAIRSVAAGDGALAPEATRSLIEAFVHTPVPSAPVVDLSGLTDREREVFMCLGEALSNRQIAARLDIGETTTKTHVARVLAKLDLTSRIQAAILAREHR